MIVCARDAGAALGTLSGAATPDFSPSGTSRTSQVGSSTGVLPSEAAARAFVALFRTPAFGRCVAAEAMRQWDGQWSGTVPAFVPGTVRVPTAAEAAGIGTRARLSDGRAAQLQFIPVRTGPIVTVVATFWLGAADNAVLARAAANIGTRQKTA